MKILKNKLNKRGDKIISVYWFAILFIVAGAVVYMTALFYGNPYDVREAEANAMVNQIADCVSESGYLQGEILNEFGNDFLEACSLNFNVENTHGWNDDQNYIEVSISDFNSKQQIFQTFSGNGNLKEFCEMQGKGFPVCLERSFYSVDQKDGQHQYQVDVLSIVRKTEKNVQ